MNVKIKMKRPHLPRCFPALLRHQLSFVVWAAVPIDPERDAQWSSQLSPPHRQAPSHRAPRNVKSVERVDKHMLYPFILTHGKADRRVFRQENMNSSEESHQLFWENTTKTHFADGASAVHHHIQETEHLIDHISTLELSTVRRRVRRMGHSHWSALDCLYTCLLLIEGREIHAKLRKSKEATTFV